jgi:hypothetical protein
VVENSSLKLSTSFLLLASHYDKRVLAIRGGFDENLLAAVGAADSVVGNGRAVEGNGSYLLVRRHRVPDEELPQRDVRAHGSIV